MECHNYLRVIVEVRLQVQVLRRVHRSVSERPGRDVVEFWLNKKADDVSFGISLGVLLRRWNLVWQTMLYGPWKPGALVNSSGSMMRERRRKD